MHGRPNLGVDCCTRGCVYQITCEECKDKENVKNKYRGQTGRSIHERMREHFDDLEKKKENSPLWQHSIEHHDSRKFPVTLKILSRCFGKPTRRLITEAVMIDELEEMEAMNNKGEYGFVRMPRVNIEDV